jgi:hypothetical protein
MYFRRCVFPLFAVLLGSSLLLGFSLNAQTSNAQTPIGRSNERIYNAPFEEVWTVCVQTANKHWKVTDTDRANGILEFRQGVSFKTNSWGMNVRVTVARVDESHTKVALNPKKIDPLELSWARKDIAKKFFAPLDSSFVASSVKTIDSPQTSSAGHE